jgi:segregation and condensation protein A
MDTDLKENFKVRVGEFEGPLELLLDLVEKRKLHISDISLSQVADEFIEHIKSFEEFPMSDSADFILVASTLLLIKSKSLLPNLDLTPEEKGNIEDLENRLADYKKYKELSLGLGKIFGNFLYFAKEKPIRLNSVIFFPTNDITLASLKNALAETLQNIPKKIETLPKLTVTKIISLEEMVDRLTDRIKNSLRTSFKDFSNMGKAEKVDVIVSFLAMLELVKQGSVRVIQEKHFEDIQIENENTGIPTYL